MNNCVVKISVSTADNYTHIDDVIYYRSGMTPDFVDRWMWFYEYLAARVKVANPRRRVEIYHGPSDILLGKAWHDYRRLALLKSRKIKLKQLQKITPDGDLFGFAQADHEQRLCAVQQQILELEHDDYPIPGFSEYINKIKDYIYHTTPIDHKRGCISSDHDYRP